MFHSQQKPALFLRLVLFWLMLLAATPVSAQEDLNQLHTDVNRLKREFLYNLDSFVVIEEAMIDSQLTFVDRSSRANVVVMYEQVVAQRTEFYKRLINFIAANKGPVAGLADIKSRLAGLASMKRELLYSADQLSWKSSALLHYVSSLEQDYTLFFQEFSDLHRKSTNEKALEFGETFKTQLQGARDVLTKMKVRLLADRSDQTEAVKRLEDGFRSHLEREYRKVLTAGLTEISNRIDTAWQLSQLLHQTYSLQFTLQSQVLKTLHRYHDRASAHRQLLDVRNDVEKIRKTTEGLLLATDIEKKEIYLALNIVELNLNSPSKYLAANEWQMFAGKQRESLKSALADASVSPWCKNHLSLFLKDHEQINELRIYEELTSEYRHLKDSCISPLTGTEQGND